MVVNPKLLWVTCSWPDRLRRSTSINTSDQYSSGNCLVTSSNVQSGSALTIFQESDPRSFLVAAYPPPLLGQEPSSRPGDDQDAVTDRHELSIDAGVRPGEAGQFLDRDDGGVQKQSTGPKAMP